MDEERKQNYNAADISTLEKMVEDGYRLSRESYKESTAILIYLQTTGRYKENKRYAKASFKTYLMDRFNMRFGTFGESKRAFAKFPKETLEYGVGLVSKVLRLCDAVKVKQVFNEIDKARPGGKEIRREKIEEIIQKNKNPEKEKLVEHKDWKAMYEREVIAHNETKAILAEAEKTIQQLGEQIEKLKKTAGIVSKMREIWKEQGAPVA